MANCVEKKSRFVDAGLVDAGLVVWSDEQVTRPKIVISCEFTKQSAIFKTNKAKQSFSNDREHGR